MRPWEFGESPLAQQRRFAAEVRDLCATVLGVEEPDPDLDVLIDALAETGRRVRARGPADPRPRVGGRAEGRVYLDHGRDVGAFNPMFPEYEITVHGPERATGAVRFPLCYEGPPGCVHGGFLAVFADCVVQHHSCAVGLTGRTRDLTLRYRRPVPVLRDLSFEIRRTVADDSIRSEVLLTRDDQRLCTATTSAVRADHADLPAVSPRRRRP